MEKLPGEPSDHFCPRLWMAPQKPSFLSLAFTTISIFASFPRKTHQWVGKSGLKERVSWVLQKSGRPGQRKHRVSAVHITVLI